MAENPVNNALAIPTVNQIIAHTIERLSKFSKPSDVITPPELIVSNDANHHFIIENTNSLSITLL